MFNRLGFIGMKKKSAVLGLVTSLILCSKVAYGTSDPNSLTELTNARLVDSVHEDRQHHPLISSAMKKVNGIIKADSEQWLNGTLSRNLYQLPDGQTSFSAYDHFTRQFEKLGVKPVYQCQRFHCGDSNFWANNVFKIPVLYGLDREQAYYIGHKTVAGQSTYYSVYTVRRGNRRTYSLVDIFKPAGVVQASVNTSETLYNQMERQGYVYLSAEDKAEFVKNINNILSNHKSLDLVITLVSPKQNSIRSFDRIKRTAEFNSEELTNQLISKGISEKRFRIIYGGIQPDISSDNQVKLVPIFNN